MHKPTFEVERAGPREIAALGFGLLALTALVVFLTDAIILVTRPLWVDEWFTVLVARREGLGQLLGDLRRGADGGTGFFHVVIWTLHKMGMPLSPIALRTLSLISVLGALVLLYALLRRSVRTDAAVGAVLAVGAHPLVVAHSYEARFYGPWLLCATFYAWSLDRSFAHGTRATTGTQALAAVLLCGVHFYGVISLVLMIVALVVRRGTGCFADSLRALRPSLAGFMAVALIVPLALGQRNAYGVRSWIPDFTAAQLGAVLGEFWLAGVPVLALASVAIAWVIRRGAGATLRDVVRTVTAQPGIAAILGLALVPLGLMMVSLAGQPSVLSRYAVTSALVWGPLAAIALQYLGRTPARMARLLFVWFWLVSYTRETTAKQRFAAEVAASRAAIARVPPNVPILTPSIHLMYPVVAESLGGSSAIRFVELPDTLLDRVFTAQERASRTKFVVTERDLARVHQLRFGFPTVVNPAAGDSVRTFALLGSRLRLAPAFRDLGEFASSVYPARRVTLVSEELAIVGPK